LKPQRVVRDLNERLAPDALIAADCGQNTGLTAQYISIRDQQRFAVSGTLASMGGGLPYAIAAALGARHSRRGPQRPRTSPTRCSSRERPCGGADYHQVR